MRIRPPTLRVLPQVLRALRLRGALSVACEFTPVACEFDPVACEFAPVACEFAPVACEFRAEFGRNYYVRYDYEVRVRNKQFAPRAGRGQGQGKEMLEQMPITSTPMPITSTPMRLAQVG